MYLPLFCRVASLALEWSWEYLSASEMCLRDSGEIDQITTKCDKAWIECLDLGIVHHISTEPPNFL